MGIPKFYRALVLNRVKKSILHNIPQFVASLSFDINGVFHAARKRKFENITDPQILEGFLNVPESEINKEIYDIIGSIILEAVQKIDPKDCLILCVDGVAVSAKIQQQRQRRFRSALESPDDIFDKNAITPGTEFMIDLDGYLRRFIGTYRDYLPPKVIYSSHLIAGEGEHKIMEYYRNGTVANGPAAKQGGVHILYGLDADLIMLSLLSPLNNIYLCRESYTEFVRIDTVRRYIINLTNRQSAIDDFVIMMFFLGNDFLPHFPALEDMIDTIDRLLDIYMRGNYILTYIDDNGRHQINWDSLKIFVEILAESENFLLSNLVNKEVKYPSRFLQKSVQNGKFYPEIFRIVWYDNALGLKGSNDFINKITQIISEYVPTEYDNEIDPVLAETQITIISEVTPQRIETMALDYMRTMAWNYLYYREGPAKINVEWAYMYYHGPMLRDLSSVMATVNVTNV